MPKCTVFPFFQWLFHDESGRIFLGMSPHTLIHVPHAPDSIHQTIPNHTTGQKCHSCEQEHDHGQTWRNRHIATVAAAEGAPSVRLFHLSLLLPLLLLLSISTCHLQVMMPLFTYVVFCACRTSKDGSEGTIFDMWHQRMCGNTPRKFPPLSSGKSH